MADQKEKKHKLTKRQELFAQYYCGNATEAAIQAGYSPETATQIGHKNLKKPAIKQAIQSRMTPQIEKNIATRAERQQFWSDIMRDEHIETKDRLKASELLGRSEGDFLERFDHSSKDGSMSTKPIVVDLGNKSSLELAQLAKAFSGQS